MTNNRIIKDRRVGDPYIDRRSGDDRRMVYDADYFQFGGIERRSRKKRRQQGERRVNYIRVSKWSSIRIRIRKTD